MKRQTISIKKKVQKKIELRNSRLIFIKKYQHSTDNTIKKVTHMEDSKENQIRKNLSNGANRIGLRTGVFPQKENSLTTKIIQQQAKLAAINKKIVDIIIPHFNVDNYRTRNLLFIVKYYKECLPNSNIIIVEQNTETDISEIKDIVNIHLKLKIKESLFCKSFLLNEGYNVHRSDYLIFADTDCVPHRSILENFNNYLNLLNNHLVLPYDKPVINLNEYQTTELIKNYKAFNYSDLGLIRRACYSNGGVLMISAENYYKIGGHDPRFVGWGAEDDAFFIKAGNTIGITRLNYDLLHMNHPKGNFDGSKNPCYKQNFAYYSEYLNNDNQKIINTIGFNHLRKNVIDIIIAHKNTTICRENNLNFALSYYREHLPNSNIIVSEVDTVTDSEMIKKCANVHLKLKSNSQYFSKSFVFNEGFKHVISDYIIFIDSDCIIEESFFSKINEIVALLDTNVILPYNPSVINLTESQTDSILNKTLKLSELSELNYRIPSLGGIFLIKAENFRAVGGFDPRFVGYGAEDDAFMIKTNHIFPIVRLDYKVYHLYHEIFYNWSNKNFNPQNATTTKDNYDNNVKMLGEYKKFNKTETIAKINEIGFAHINRQTIQQMKIKIVTNYQSEELYAKSKAFYEDLGFEMIGVDGSNHFYGFPFFNYMMTHPSFADCDWIIYVDEDCFISNKKAMLELLNYQIKNNIHCSGVPDGGVISHRFHNPISIIAFFMIINIGELRKKYNPAVANTMAYGHDLDKFIPHHLINTNRPYEEKFSRTIARGYSPYGVIYDNFEPTYKLFFWLLRQGYNMLYLDAYDYPNDDLTTVIKNHNGVDFGYHTWFARDWNIPSNKERITKIINHCNSIKD